MQRDLAGILTIDHIGITYYKS